MSGKSLSLGIVIGASLGSTFGRTFGTVEERSKRIGDSLKRAKLGSAIAGDLLKYKRKLDQLKKAEQLTGVSSDAMKAKIAKAQAEFERAARKAGKYGIEVGNAARRHREFEREVRRSEQALARLERRQRNMDIRGGMKGEALGMIGAAYGLGRFFSGSMEKETAGVRLKTVLNSDNIERDLALAKKHATAFMRKGLTDDVQMLNIQYALNSAGLEASAARIGSEVVAKVATVTSGAPEQVGEVVATVFNNLGDSLEGNVQERLTRVGELLTKTQFKFQIRDFGQLGESMKYASPIMSQYNMQLEQGVTLIGALNSAGLQGSQAGTALGATMRNMSKASEELGFDLVRNAKGQLDMVATMESLSDAIGGFDNMDQETIDQLQELFGDEGIRGVVLLGKQLGKLRQAQEDVTRSSKGLVDSSYKEFLDSTPGKVKRFWHNTRLLGDTMAEAFLPVINQVLPPLIGYVSQIGQAIAANPELGKTIVGVVAGLTALKGMSMATRFGLTLLSDGGMLLGGVFRFLKGGIGLVIPVIRTLGMVLMANPIGLLIGGIALAAGLVIANWTEVKAFLLELWEPVKPYWESFTNWLGGLWDSVQERWKQFGDWIGKFWNKIKSPFETVSKFGQEVGGTIGGWFSGDEEKKVNVRRAAAGTALSAALAVTPAAADSGAVPLQVSVTAPITIHATPGMDEEHIAELVDQRIGEAVRRAIQEARDAHG